jgi:hypothetical protein
MFGYAPKNDALKSKSEPLKTFLNGIILLERLRG